MMLGKLLFVVVVTVCLCDIASSEEITAESGLIKSKNKVDGVAVYGNNINRVINFNVEGAIAYTFTFTNVDVEQDYDFIKIYKADRTEVQTITGTTDRQVIEVPSASAVVEFTTDDTTGGQGWELSYTTTKANVPAGPEEITAESGLIKSKNKVDGVAVYGNNIKRTLNFNVEGATAYRFTFTNVDVEQGYDFIKIYKGDKTEVQTITGKTDRQVVEVPSDKAVVEFTTDDTTGGTGWELRYTATKANVPAGPKEFTDKSGSAGSPNKATGQPTYADNTNQVLKFNVKGATSYTFTFTDVDVEENYDWIRIYNADDKEVATITGNINNKVVKVESNRAVVKFTSDDSTGGGGWSLQYSATVDGDTPPSGDLSECYTFSPPRNGRGVHEIVGGTVATHGDFPFQVKLNDNNGIVCGGTLISDSWVLTATHCVEKGKTGTVVDPSDTGLKVALGDHDLSHSADNEVSHDVIKIVPAPGYNFPHNDIALMKLKDKVTFTDKIRKACLPTGFEDETFIGKKVWLSGWGTIPNSGLPSKLHYVEVPVKDSKFCRIQPERRKFFLCVGGYMKGSCRGDSGGPAVYGGGPNSKAYIVGVTSFGFGDCTQGPSGYTRVTAYLKWIKDTIDVSVCKDNDVNCAAWAADGECKSKDYADYMLKDCKKSCGVC